MGFLLVAICIGTIPGFIAQSKGRSFVAWWFYGAALFIFALPHSLLIKVDMRQIEREQLQSGTARKCPFCAEIIKAEARVCRFCGRDLPPEEPKEVQGEIQDSERQRPGEQNEGISAGMVDQKATSEIQREFQTNSKKTNVGIGVIIVFASVVSFAIIWVVAGVTNGGTSSGGSLERSANADVLPDGVLTDRSQAHNRVDQYSPIAEAYGRPDKDDSTAYDNPRPPLVTRIIEYQPEGVRIAFIPIGKATKRPPYAGWTVIGYINTKLGTKMSKYEAAERLKGRLQKSKKN